MHLHNSLVVFLKYAKSRIFQWYACYWQISFMWECSLFFLLCLFLWQVKKWSHLQVISKHCVIGYNRRNKYTAGELVSEFLFSLGSMVKIFRYKINQTHLKAIFGLLEMLFAPVPKKLDIYFCHFYFDFWVLLLSYKFLYNKSYVCNIFTTNSMW